METYYKKEYGILPSVCDDSGRMRYSAAFACFMDIAAQHADLLGIGYKDLLRRGFFWLTVKTKIIFIRRPSMGETVELVTWPEIPGKIRCNRSYEMKQGEKRLLYGKTEWAIVEMGTKRMIPAGSVYPEGLCFPEKSACGEAFVHVPDRFDNAEIYARHQVCSNDIDIGGHMNNAAYLTALMGTFSCHELAAMNIRSIDALFRSPCYEGDELIWQRTRTEEGFVVKASNEEKTAFLSSIRFQ